MKCSYTIFLATLLGGGVFGANSKLNQYASISDCVSDVNIISHASPAEGSCHSVDPRTGALYLVTGGGALDAHYEGRSTYDCHNSDINPYLEEGTCITPPSGLQGIYFGNP